MSGVPPTGGQLCVRGILQQMLRGLAQGTELAFKDGKVAGGELRSVLLTFEPFDGGDQQAQTTDRRVVEQMKIRTTGKPWTTGEIAGEVLHDLLRAVKDQSLPTVYRFTTDGALNCDELLRMRDRLAGREIPDDPVAALDDADTNAFHYGGPKSERAFFLALYERAKGKSARALWEVIANLEIEGDISERRLIKQIDDFLRDIVDFGEDVEAKRAHLIVLMMGLASKGGNITFEALLEQADLPVERTLHYAKLPLVTSEALKADLAILGYDATHDVRDPPRAAGTGITLFAGDSGYGKSWRIGAMLRALDREGHLVVMATNAGSLAAIQEKITDLVWHSSFDKAQSMPGLQRRLGHRFVDDDGVWLTVGIDDVQDRTLVAALRAANWAQYGIRVVATVPSWIAEEFSKQPQSPSIAAVGRFSLPQVRAFLKGHGRNWVTLPPDVVELLQTPIFADLYRRLDHDEWLPLDEYALLDRFWRYATYDIKGMAAYQDDAIGLEQLARTLLRPTGRYPWTTKAAMTAGLKQNARARLVKSGILRQGATGTVVLHDRVLNWVIARAIVDDVVEKGIGAQQVLRRLERVNMPDKVAPGLGHRLGYVLLDVLWLLCRCVDADLVGEVISALLQSPHIHLTEKVFIEEHLPGLGAPLLPALAILAQRTGENHRSNAIHAARAIATIGKTEKGPVDAVIADLLKEGQSEAAIRSGLIAAAGLVIPAAIERLWNIHLARAEANEAALGDEDLHKRHNLSQAAQTSFDAIKRTAAEAPDWIGATLDQSTGPIAVEKLLELLLEVEHGAGLDVWKQRKATFFARIPPGKSILPRAIKHFGDSEETDRLELESDGADWREPQRRFDALIRIAPARAVKRLEEIGPDLLGWRSWFSVARLVRNGGDNVRAILLSRHPQDWEGMADLAHTYWHDRLKIDQASFRAMITALERRLADCAGQPWAPTRERTLVRFLAETARPDLLAILESYRGSEFERLLREVATSGKGRDGLGVDPDADQIECLLMMIGGTGYRDMVAAQVARERPVARRDGYQAAIHLPKGEIASDLSMAANADKATELVAYDLTLALAVHGCDAQLYASVVKTHAAYNDAIDVREKQGPWSSDVETQLRGDLASSDSAARIGATCALAMAPPPDALDLLVETLARCPDDDPSSLTVVRISAYLRLYSPAMLPQLERMLTLGDEKIREAVLPYLAEVGDDEAHGVARAMLASGMGGKYDRSVLRAAYAVSEHDAAEGAASARLLPFLDLHHGMYPVGLIARRLHDIDVVSDAALIDLGYSSEDLSSDCVFILVDRIKVFDPVEARAIAERRFARRPSAGGARQILELGVEEGLDYLIEAYLAEKLHEVRWLIARALRRHGDRELVLDRLAALAGRNSSNSRMAAAELLGWIPGERSAALLAALVDDPIVEVSDAALEGEGRAEAENWGKMLIAEIPGADHLGRWSRLYALIDLVDPYLIEQDSDGLAIGDTVEGLDEICAIVIEKELVTRKKALTQKAQQLDGQT